MLVNLAQDWERGNAALMPWQRELLRERGVPQYPMISRIALARA